MDKEKEQTQPAAEEQCSAQQPTPEATTPEPSPLEALRSEFAALNDRYMRVLAEYDNYRKRSAKERESLYPQAQAEAITPLLPVLDNFDRALQTECTDETYRKGMEMIYQNLWDALTKLGVEPVGQVGDLFDPLLHNAVMHVEQEEVQESTVVEVFQKGYRMKDKILRYAMVKVAN